MKPEHIAQELRLHNAWRRGEGVYEQEGVHHPMPQTPKELGELIEAAAVSCDRVQLLTKALRSIAKNSCCDTCQEAAKVASKALAEAGLQEKE